MGSSGNDNFGSSNVTGSDSLSGGRDDFGSSGRTGGSGLGGSDAFGSTTGRDDLGSSGRTGGSGLGGSDNYGSSATTTDPVNADRESYGASGRAGGLGSDNIGSDDFSGTGGAGANFESSAVGGGLGRAGETSSYDKNNDSTYGSGGVHGSSGTHGTTAHGHNGGGDSTLGKVLEKAGGLLNNEKLEAKGQAKRDEAGSGGYGGSEGNY